MGSFNKIGFLSSLPISSGDETTLIFLKPNKYWADEEEIDELKAIFAEMKEDDRADTIDLILT